MPKVQVYVRADDARAIEAMEHCSLRDWVRAQVAKAVADWQRDMVEKERDEYADR